jgi:8-oxo-dGTP pyrophosphatase MutT (NUDIX family)
MAHIHEKIDFTVAIFVVHDQKILLIHHRKLDKWLPLGGHIELEEDPEQAALRETKEESGLDVELLGERPPTTSPGTRALIGPRFLDIHRISDTHEHIGMIYWARPKVGSSRCDDLPSQGYGKAGRTSQRDVPTTCAVAEHHDIRWCSASELDSLQPAMSSAVKWYCLKAIEEISNIR